jgi:type IV secretory pathway VirB2 component (pilin)
MNNKELNSNIFLSFLAIFFVLALPEVAAATTSGNEPTAIETTLCKVLGLIQGGVGKGIAAFGIIFIGISLFLGKVSWGLAISTALGIGAIFGAGSIVSAISGSGSEFCGGDIK